MNAEEMRLIQAPLKDRYRADPKAGLVTLRAKGALDSAGIACKVETGRALAVAGLHPATGGSGAELCSGDMLLEALVACAGVTLKAVATHARRRKGCAGRLRGHPAQIRARHRRAAGSARHFVEAHRALLRGAADAEAFAEDRSEARPDVERLSYNGNAAVIASKAKQSRATAAALRSWIASSP